MAGPDLRHRMQQAVRGNARRNRSSDRLKKRRLYIHLCRGRAIFLTHCAWVIPARLFRVCADALDRDGAGAQPHTRHGQLPSTPLTASVLRDIEGGVPVEADHILGDLLRGAGVAADNRTLVRIANAHAKAYEARRARNRAASAASSQPPRAAHVRSRGPAQKRKSCGNCQPCIEPLLGGRQISRSGKLRLRKAKALDPEASRIEQGAPRRLLAAKRPVRIAGESDVPSRRGAIPVAAEK